MYDFTCEHCGGPVEEGKGSSILFHSPNRVLLPCPFFLPTKLAAALRLPKDLTGHQLGA